MRGDDILGSLSKKFESSDLAVQIITGDRDNFTVLLPITVMYFLTKKRSLHDYAGGYPG